MVYPLVLELVVERVIDFSLRESSKNRCSFGENVGVLGMRLFGAGVGELFEWNLEDILSRNPFFLGFGLNILFRLVSEVRGSVVVWKYLALYDARKRSSYRT